MGEERNWENLEFDCLVNILGRVGIESLLLDVPFVCKSWHDATFNPLCWQHINIRPKSIFFHGSYKTPFVNRFLLQYDIVNFSIGGFVSLLFSRGIGKYASLVLTENCDDKDLEYVANKCPELKSISLNWYVLEYYHFNVTKVIRKLKQLEEMELFLGNQANFGEIAAVIGENCKSFNSLIVNGDYFGKSDALAIADHLPKINKLKMEVGYLKQEDLEIIVRGCEELECLDISVGGGGRLWSEEDEKKLKQSALHVKTINLDL